MITASNQHPPGLLLLLRRLLHTGAGALHNRAELFSIEWQQEKARLAALLVLAGALLFAGVVGAILLMAAIIMLCPPSGRIYAVAGLALLNLGAALWCWFALKKMLSVAPFPDSLNQLKKDGQWWDTLKTRN